jgi:tetratricopeptide (TPR) repeat protein
MDFEKAIKINPNDVIAYYNCGRVKTDTKEFTEAISYFNKALALDSKQAYLYNSRGVAEEALKKYNEALSDFKKATELDPTNEGFKTNLKAIQVHK